MAARTDLTSRELSKLIGALLGGLVQMAEVEELKVAVKWWAETPEAWKHLEAIKTLVSVGGSVDIDKPKDGFI